MHTDRKWTIGVFFDGYLWCAYLGGDFLGRYPTEREAFAYAYGAKLKLAFGTGKGD